MATFIGISLLALGLIQSSSAAVAPRANAWYSPPAGEPWQIVLEANIGDLNLNGINVYDIDLYTTPQETIDTLHKNGKKVICYFSAGTYEPGRPDSAELSKNPSELGATLAKEGFKDERWVDIRKDHIVDVMKARIDLAKSKKCDGLDPDNVDGYDNDNGGGFNPPLKESDSVTFLNKLAAYAHDSSHNMGIGLKNSGAIVEATKTTLDWVVNEQCVQFSECDTFSPFISVGTQGKPVFHIEYQVDPNSSTPPASLHDDCYGPNTDKFSTVIKPNSSSIPADTVFCSSVPSSVPRL